MTRHDQSITRVVVVVVVTVMVVVLVVLYVVVDIMNNVSLCVWVEKAVVVNVR
jgi:hypothetical protein